MQTNTIDVTTTVDRYLEAYNERDAERRSELITSVWADDAQLIDPPLAAKGHAEIGGLAQAMHEHYAGHSFRRTSGIDEHHGQLRYAWELVGPDGQVAVAGIDAAEIGEDGRLRRVVGFFGDLPPRD